MLAVWFDQYASVFLSIGGARLSARLRRVQFRQWQSKGLMKSVTASKARQGARKCRRSLHPYE
jgi:hypothetical protein